MCLRQLYQALVQCLHLSCLTTHCNKVMYTQLAKTDWSDLQKQCSNDNWQGGNHAPMQRLQTHCLLKVDN